jgi:glycosyltransferase involved in cell wall biosynthesis
VIARPDLSVVVEWENAGRIGVARARLMLAQLHRQLLNLPRQLAANAEILFVFEAEQVDEATLRTAIAAQGDWPAEIRTFPSDTAGYYEQKNIGAERARGDIIVFLDSDVVPEPGWLEALLAPFHTKGAQIVAGATSVERKSLYSTAMAIGWIFPLPPEERDVGPAHLFYANNVAFRREMIAAMRFPEAQQYRVQVGVVQRRLAASTYRILSNPAAAVLHPPPAGPAAFLTRALWCGYDAATELPREGRSILLRAPWAFASQVRAALRRVRRERRRAGFGLTGAAAACGIIAGYQFIRGAGYTAGLVAPAATFRFLKRIAP